MIEVAGESDELYITFGIRIWKQGNYPFNETDSTGFNSFGLVIAKKDRTDPLDFIFGWEPRKSSNWNVIALQDFNLTDRDPETGKLNRAGKIGKMEVKFDAIEENGKAVTDGYLNISYK
ncbi:MAG: hypothetical protein H0X62_03530 [Bacteroidetes bacterium]|nr:hypothetical protein [Bacteroidota bacterium]